ncbi:hypothetical protein CAEBREN_04555 [Caenorhabditis brenneri]|uniref:F-box domain-containing protein n=1 Tax=Caenorhabditis brenneri TaxID=135651 RepID=G0MII5_CAEBE|nr:hypothetical protein CAEBREN_04555 [Caenorhabditis brenneri]
MSFPLRRLPFLAIREVIQSMDTREIFLFSLVSKKSRNFVMSSIPKNSLSAEFTFRRYGFLLELMPKGYFKQEHDIVPDASYRIRGEFLLTSASSDNLNVQCDFHSSSRTSVVQEYVRKLFYRFSKTFKKSKINIKFEDGTREEFAMGILRFAWRNGFPLDRIDFRLKYSCPKTIRRLLKGCQEHTSMYIGTKLPEGFKYTPPPGGYKLESLIVDYPHWINPDDFLQCREVDFGSDFLDLTVEYLNGLLKKIINMECRFESFLFKLKSIKPTDFQEIVKGLSERAIKQDEVWQVLEFERKDGLKLLVSLHNGYLELYDDYL